MKIIVFDIGGTNFRSAIYEPTLGRMITDPRIEKTPGFIAHPNLPIQKVQELLLEKIVAQVKLYLKQHNDLKSLAISFPGPVTSKGVIRSCSSLWGKDGKNFPLLDKLKKLLPDMNAIVVNDMTAAAERYMSMYEYRKTAPKFMQVITVSTGIGAKVCDVKKRRVLLDSKGIGGEIGHVRVDFSDNAPICNCGSKGHLDAMSSGSALERITKEWIRKYPTEYSNSKLFLLINSSVEKKVENRLIVAAIKSGDAFALKLLDQTTFYLAKSIYQSSADIGIDKFIFIGGLARAIGRPYLESIKRNLLKFDFYNRSKTEVLESVVLGGGDDNDCLFGAGAIAYQRFQHSLLQTSADANAESKKIYQAMQISANEQGIKKELLSKIKHDGLKKQNHIAFGYPFPKLLTDRLVVLRDQIFERLHLAKKDFLCAPPETLHSNIISSCPENQLPKAAEIIAKFKPIEVVFNGFVLGSDGSLLLKGFVENDDLSNLRKKLHEEIKTNDKKNDSNIIYVEAAQILTPVPNYKVRKINRAYNTLYLGEYVFTDVKNCKGDKIQSLLPKLALNSGSAFFSSKMGAAKIDEDAWLKDSRQLSPYIQHEYDKKFGLMPTNKL